MKHIFYFLLLCLANSTAFAQTRNGTIEGTITDSTGLGLSAATVTLLQQKDSVLVSYAVTNPEGGFLLKRVTAGDYILQVSYVGYRNHAQLVKVAPDNGKTDVGRILLVPDNLLLQGVDITAQQAPLSIRQDTIEYNTAAFKTQPGAVVEDLLKKLPGIQVQSDGSIKAQGETVQNVLVDGKEFFGQDPKIATKNLAAEAVDKVQVYDKKSDKAEFTGIDDGREQKTINLTLKADKKQGYFGNASGGYGTTDRFEGKFNVNRFGKKTQFSALGMGNNTNQQGFSFDDYINLMGGLANFMTGSSSSAGSGRVRITINPEETGLPMGSGLENGFTTTAAGGLNMNSDLSKKTEISANYFYSHLQNNMERTTTRTNLLGSEQFGSVEDEDRLSRNASHRLNLTLRHKPDSASNLLFRSRLSINDARLDSRAQSATSDVAGLLQNTSTRDYFSIGSNLSGNASLVYRRHLGRKGRSLVADLNFQGGDDGRDGLLRAQNDYLSGPNPSREAVSQRQEYADASTHYGGSVAYTEPLGRRQYFEWQVSREQYANRTSKNFYDLIETPTPGEVFNPILSNRYRRGYRYDRGSMNYLLNRPKYNLTAGLALQHSQLDGELVESGTPPLQRDFTRLLPSVFFNYDLRTGRNFSAEYTTQLREPSLEQLQPVVDNSDPLNIYTGNTNLKPEYVHELGVNFLNFDQFTMTSIFANLRATYIQDRITNASNVDALFRRFTSPVNVKQDWLLNGYVNFSTPLRFIKSNLNLSLNSTYNRGILFVNDIQNNTDRWMNSVELALYNRKKERVDITLGMRLGQNTTRYSISAALNQAFVNQTYFTECTVFPSKKWAISSGLDYTLYSGENFGAQRAVPLWRASLTRYVLENNRGQIKLAVFDLLNRNIGISRSSEFNYLEEVRIRNLGRYAMLTFAYSISGFNKKPGGIEIRMQH